MEHADFDGSHSAVKRLFRALRRARGVQAEDVAIPVETAAGEIAQVDFGYVGQAVRSGDDGAAQGVVLRDGAGLQPPRGHRGLQSEDRDLAAARVEAFAELGGVVETVVPDNLKAAVVRAAFAVDDHSELNRSYRSGAPLRLQGGPDAAWRQLGRKGQGRGGGEVRQRRLRPASRTSRRCGAILDGGCRRSRAHASTICNAASSRSSNSRPSSARRSDRLPKVRWEPVVWRRAKVHRDAHIAVDKRLSSVHWKHIGQRVWVRMSAHTMTVCAADERVATHNRRGPEHRHPRQSSANHRADFAISSPAFYEPLRDAPGEEVAYVRAIFDSRTYARAAPCAGNRRGIWRLFRSSGAGSVPACGALRSSDTGRSRTSCAAASTSNRCPRCRRRRRWRPPVSRARLRSGGTNRLSYQGGAQ